MNKAEQFLAAAETIREFADDEAEVGDTYVTLCVHAGIAAADVVCCTELGRHAQGDGHNEAITLIGQVRPDGDELGRSLRTLLTMKTRAGYSHRRVITADLTRAGRAAERLLRAARDRHHR
jgi:hypothetical protein